MKWLIRTTTACLLAVQLTSSANAQTMIVLQPDEAHSKDTFDYEFSRPGLFGISTPPRQTNFDTETLALANPTSPLGILLASAKSDVSTSSDPQVAHGASVWIGFDLSTLNLSSANIVSATLNLYAINGETLVSSVLGQPAFGNPTPATPLPTSVYTPNGPWEEKTITWENEPGEETLLSTVQIQGVDQWVTWDVTAAAKGWVNGSPNNGLFVEQEEVVPSATAMTHVAAALYASSAFADATKRPFLAITVVPEPNSLSLAGLGGLALLRRRCRGFVGLTKER